MAHFPRGRSRPRPVLRHRVLTLLVGASFVACGQGEAPPGTSLVDLLPLADVLADTRAVDFGDPASRRILLAGWGEPERPEGASYAWGLGEASTLFFEIGWVRPVELVLSGQAFVFPGAPPQVVDVLLNGEPVGAITMHQGALPPRGYGGGGLQEYPVPLPAAALRTGRNELELRYAYSRSPAAVDPASSDTRELAVAWHGLRLAGAAEAPPPQAAGDALLLPPFTGVSYYFRLPQGGRLTLGGAGLWRDWGGDAAAEAAVTVGVAVAGSAAEAQRTTVPLARAGDVSLDLPAAPDRPIRVTLWAAWEGGGAGVRLIRPEVHVDGAGVGEAERAERSLAASGRRPNVLVYMIDTLRADHLGCYGYDRPTSPAIDRFAGEATLFTTAQAQSPWTRPSVASIFTGLYPEVHGTNERDDALPPEVVPLAETLFEAGYQTAAVITNGNVNTKFGFARGFESFTWLRERADTPHVHEPADKVNEAAFAWLEQRDRERPFFLYLHPSDPHGPYTPPAPFRQRFARRPSDDELGSNDSITALGNSREPVDAATRDGLVDLYDAEIAFTDAAFGQLLDRLRALDLYDSTLVVLVSDHGEEFFEHGRTAHGKSLFQEQLAVPLVMRFPDGRGRGSRVAGTARQIDILPTLLAYLGEPVAESVQGRSLLPLVAGTVPEPFGEPSYAYLHLDGRRLESVTAARRKLIDYIEYDRPVLPFELFDLSRDPGEQRDLSLTEPVWRGYLESLLRFRRQFWRAVDAPQVETDDELRRQLRAAGYLQ